MRGTRIVAAVCAAMLLWPPAGAAAGPDASTADGEQFCLIEKDDVVLEDSAVDTRHQTTESLSAPDQEVTVTQPGPPDEPLVFAADRLEAAHLCANLATDHAAVKVELTDVRMRGVTITGRVMKVTYPRGTASKLTLWITLASAIELLPELGSAMNNRSVANATTAEYGA